ncbi:MAG: histidine phosphatase family protein [Propionibacteriaceae bacterium]
MEPDRDRSHRIALVRHGVTQWNNDRLMQGSSDIPMLPEGYEQARGAGKVLAELGGWERLVASPLGRARATATEIAPFLGIDDVATDPDLTERNFGEAEGMAVERASQAWPDKAFTGAETEDETARRGAASITRWSEHPGVVLVAHGTLIRLAVGRLIDGEFPRLPNAAVVLVQRDGDTWSAELAGQQGTLLLP